MADVQQSFGLDASAALQALSQLDSGFSKLSSTLNTVTNSVSQFNSASKNLSSGAGQIGSAFSSAAGQSQRLTTSMALLSRITFTQVAIKGIRELEATFSEALSSAIKFQTGLAEVQTIASGSLGSLGQLSGTVRTLSDSFNINIEDATKGLYQALSLGFGQKAPEFLASASTLAKASVSSLEDSVNTLGGALNAFGGDASQADQVASQLVKTVQLGAVRLPDLAQAMGRVNTTAAEIGVSFPEVAAAFASISVRGVKASEAATEIRASLTALTKPTAELTEVLHQNGFASSQAAISTLGYGGALKLIYDAAGGSQERLAQLVPNIRGFAGVLSLAGEGSKRFAENLAQIKNAPSNLAATKAGDVLGIDAQKVSANITQLRNAITVDLGQSILAGLSNVIDLTGGVKNLSSSFETVAPALAVATAGLALYATAAVAGATATQGLITAGTKYAALGALAYGLGKSIGESYAASQDAPRLDFDAAADKEIEALKKSNADKLQDAQNADQGRIDSALKAVQALNIGYLQDVSNAAAANASIVTNAKHTTDELIAGRAKYVEELGKASEQAREIARSSTGRVADLERKQGEHSFNSAISGESDSDQVASRLARAKQEADAARAQLETAGKSGNQFGIDQALKGFGSAQQEGEIAATIANRTKDRKLEASAAAQLKSITDTQIAAEQELQAQQKKRQTALSAEQDHQNGIRKQLVAQAEILTKNSELFDKTGKLKPQATLDSQATKRQGALDQIAKLGFSQKDISTADALGLTKFVTENQQKLVKDPAKLKFDVEGGIADIQSKMTASFANFKLKISPTIDIEQLKTLVGHAFNNPDEVAKGLTEGEKLAQQSRAQAAQKPVDDLQQRKLRGDIDLSLSAAPGRSDLSQQIKAEIAAAAKSPAVTTENIQSIFGKLSTLAQPVLKAGFTSPADPITSTTVDQLSKALGSLNNLKGIQEHAAQQQAQPVQSIDRVLPAGLQGSAEAARSIDQSMQSAAGAAKQAAAAFERPPLPTTEQHSFGGPIYRAGGGPVGTDTVPAWLSPGETVVNSRASSKWYSQLQAINAGVTPRQPAPTSIDNSSHIGDIHVNGAGNPKQTAREVINAIRREQRRGSGYPVNQGE